MTRELTLIKPKGAGSSIQAKGFSVELHSSFIVTRGRAGYVDTDTSRFVNTVEGACSCSVLTASILSVK